jgi:hypothetical protein
MLRNQAMHKQTILRRFQPKKEEQCSSPTLNEDLIGSEVQGDV